MGAVPSGTGQEDRCRGEGTEGHVVGDVLPTKFAPMKMGVRLKQMNVAEQRIEAEVRMAGRRSTSPLLFVAAEQDVILQRPS